MDKLWRGAFLNPIMKHHRTGSHGEHVIPVYIHESNEEIAQEYDDDLDNEFSYDGLVELGDGGIPYLFQVKIAGGGAATYDYLVNLDDTTPEEYREAADLYDIPPEARPSPAFYPDIYEGLALIIADQLGVSREDLEAKNTPPFSPSITAEAVMEVYEE